LNGFAEWVLHHMDLIYQYRDHFLFDELHPAQLADFHESINQLQFQLQRGCVKPVQEHASDPRFHTMCHGRLQKFPNSQESVVQGENHWYQILIWSSSTLLHSALRRIFVRYFSWGVISLSAINAIKKYGSILEVGSGTGYWAYELSLHGVDIIATDNFSELVEDFSPLRGPWVSIENIDAKEAIQKYRDRTLLMVWPHGYALDALETLTEVGGSTVIIIGDQTQWFDKSCITDDPFGGVNKENDYRMMEQVRMILEGKNPVEHVGELQPFDMDELVSLAERYKKMRGCWKLVEKVAIPNFVTTEEEEPICDCMVVYQRTS